MTAYRRQDVLITILSLALLTAWDSAGIDMPLMRSLGNASGFAWREVVALQWMHSGGRAVAWAVMAWMVWLAFTEPKRLARGALSARGLPAHRRYWIGITLACLLLVNLIKRTSATSCPWDLAEFGGVAQHISHWALLARDGGPGQCFPSGHSSAAFAFFTLYFLHRQTDSRRANFYLVGVCVAGVAFSLTQIARGAHYPSHALWSAWLSWALCCLADAWLMRQRAMPVPAPR